MSSTRQEKVSSLIQRQIAAYLVREELEGLKGLLTITKVDVSPDLEHGKVFFSVVGQNEDEVLGILKRYVYEIQGLLNRALKMRKVPRIAFYPDTSGAYAQHIGGLIRDLTKHDHESGA